MKQGLIVLTTSLMLLSLTACGEEEIVYEESPLDLVTEYVLGEDDTAPAFFTDVFKYIEENVLPVEEVDPDAPVVELSKEEEKLAKEEAKRLEAANELLQAELDKENNRLGSIRLVSCQDPTEANAAALEEAKLAHEEELAAQVVVPTEVPEGESAEQLSSEEELEEAAPAPTPEPDDSYLQEVEQAAFVYTYDVSSTGYTGGQSTDGYVSYLQGSGFKIIDPFHPVNNEYYEMLTPDFTQRAGTVALAKKASGIGRLMLLTVDWHLYGATVTVEYVDGTLWVAPKVTTTSRGALSIQDAVDFLSTRNPSDLGLSGNTMDDYNIYTAEGLIMINGVSYRQFNISGKAHDGNGNTFAGSYLINADGLTYSVDAVTGAVMPLQITNVFDALP